MVLVKVLRVSSITDPVTGLPGRQIELVEQRQLKFPPKPVSEEGAIIQTVLMQLQSTGLFPPLRDMQIPKIILYLREDEYNMLGVDFDVNDVYEVTMKDGKIIFQKVETEQVR